MAVRFIEAAYTPMCSRGGWAVPLNNEIRDTLSAEIDVATLSRSGLVEGEDYKVVRHKDDRIKRIVFHTDMAFIQAKMICS